MRQAAETMGRGQMREGASYLLHLGEQALVEVRRLAVEEEVAEVAGLQAIVEVDVAAAFDLQLQHVLDRFECLRRKTEREERARHAEGRRTKQQRTSR